MKNLFLLAFLIASSFIPLNAQYSKLHDFTGATDGSHPQGGLVSDGTFLYGMTNDGGTLDFGVVFKIKPDGTGYVRLHSFAGPSASEGCAPYGSLLLEGVYLYGMTSNCGASGNGSIFKMKTDGTGYTELLDFSGTTDGATPQGTLIADTAFLYGQTAHGGTTNRGTIFKIRRDGTGYVKLLDFTGAANGDNPKGPLFSDGTFLYGTTAQGGTQDKGVVFKIMPDGTGYVKLLDFTGAANGETPFGGLISDGTFLYGTTVYGGANNMGLVFKMMPDGTGYSDICDFADTANGKWPHCSLFYDGTFLYGTTICGGTNNRGVLFKILPTGAGYVKLLDFTGSYNGGSPGDLLFSDGIFLYGLTAIGGAGNFVGTVYKYDYVTGITENNAGANFNLYPNPSGGAFSLNSEFTKGAIIVYNAFGEPIFQSALNSTLTAIDLSDEPNGIYFITLKTPAGSSTQKIVITRNN